MAREAHLLPESCDVAVVGGGPAGLAAATCLKLAGVESVVVLEREPNAGGIPRHCGHPPFGMREFNRCLTGQTYARALVERAEKVDVRIHVNTSVVSLEVGGGITVSSTQGDASITAGRVILCTGVRETPRSTRMVSGCRPLGIFTTGSLQSMVYLKNSIPFRRPVIIGTELVSFSALLTARHAGIKPVAMIEENACMTARAYCRPLPMILGVPLYRSTHVLEIMGKERVTGVRIMDNAGTERTIDCDGVLFTGQFTPESSLLRMAHLEVDPASGGPVVDQYGRCSDPSFFATGNLLRPVETAGWCWREGVRTAAVVVRSLDGQLPLSERTFEITSRSSLIKYIVPQIISLPHNGDGAGHLQLRFQESAKGSLCVQQNGETTWRKTMHAKPERRVLVPTPRFTGDVVDHAIEISFSATS